MKQILIIILCIGMSSGTTWGQHHKWTLEECLDYAAKNNMDIRKSKAQNELADINILQQKAEWYPTLSANASQSLTYRPFQEGSTGFLNGNAMTSSNSKTSHNGSYGINAAWTVFNGNQTANNIKIAKMTAQQSTLQTEISINSVKEQIVQLFINIMYTTEALSVNKELLKQDETLYERGKQLLAQGQIARYELLELQAAVANGKYDTVNTQTQIDQYKLQLKQLMNMPGDKDFDIATTIPSEAKALAPIPETAHIYAQALSTRPEIKNANMSIYQSQLDYKVAKAGYLPTVSMSAGMGDNHSSGAHKDWFEQMKRNFDASFGLSVSIPIFDGRRNKTNVQKAEVNKMIAILAREDVANELYNTIASFRLNAYNNQQKLLAGKERLKYNEENFNAIFTKASIGTMNIVETMNARALLLNAQQDVLQSKYLTIYNRGMLEFYAGNGINL